MRLRDAQIGLGIDRALIQDPPDVVGAGHVVEGFHRVDPPIECGDGIGVRLGRWPPRHALPGRELGDGYC
ncbi:MAG: hypothetical protein WEA29_02325 [Acidimicrobiia bacterium]